MGSVLLQVGTFAQARSVFLRARNESDQKTEASLSEGIQTNAAKKTRRSHECCKCLGHLQNRKTQNFRNTPSTAGNSMTGSESQGKTKGQKLKGKIVS